MEIRAVLLTVLSLAFIIGVFGFGLRPVWERLYRYVRALKEQDAEATRDQVETERLRLLALKELQDSPAEAVQENPAGHSSK